MIIVIGGSGSRFGRKDWGCAGISRAGTAALSSVGDELVGLLSARTERPTHLVAVVGGALLGVALAVEFLQSSPILATSLWCVTPQYCRELSGS